VSPLRIVHTRPGLWPERRPGRFADNVREAPEGCGVALLGLPDDTGVRLNFGRPGAKDGPNALRAALSSFGTTFDALRQEQLATLVFDAGDVEPAAGDDEAALFETHRRVEAAARALHELGLVVIGLGGGHDLSLPTLSALSKHAGHAIGGINVDAHLDVRQRVGSGMPFRRLIDGGSLDPAHFVELGLGRFSNDQQDFEWLLARGAELVLVDDVLRHGLRADALLDRALRSGVGFLSIDLDGLDAAVAPGVSARNPHGLRVEHASELAEAAGARSSVRHFDMMELCPPHDSEGRTARTAAYLLLSFMAGYARRPA
jgi:formimidoylglutamase